MATVPQTSRKPLEEPLARVMFLLSLCFLMTAGAILHRHQQFDLDDLELRLQLAFLAVLWLVFLGETLLRWSQRDRSHSRWIDLEWSFLICVLPPCRIGARSQGPGREIWFPFLGWRAADKDLVKDFERLFGWPMIVLAFMVLPLLAVEYIWPHQSEDNPLLASFLALGASIIWFAFAFEFVVMISVSERKLSYCLAHWIDLAIIVLPIVQFLPLMRTLRLTRLLREERLASWGAVYRLEGLALKAWQAFLLLQILQRLTRSPEKRLKRLEALLAIKVEEIEILRSEIAEVRQLVLKQAAREPAPAPVPNPVAEPEPIIVATTPPQGTTS
jgi:voltage-gated potassium channel